MSDIPYRYLKEKYSNLKGLHLARAGKRLPGTINDLCMEVYNPGTDAIFKKPNPIAFDIRFVTCHPDWKRMHFLGQPPTFWAEFVCKPNEWIFLPHSSYIKTFWKDGKEHHVDAYQVVVNFGDAMFKGEKLPSRPEAYKFQVRGGI